MRGSRGGVGWTAEKQKARYHQLRAEGRCVRCRALMLPEWSVAAHCPMCKELVADHSRKYRSTEKGRAFVAKTNAKRRAQHGFRAKENERARVMRLEKKLAGICRYCSLPCLDDSVFCEEHRERSRRQTREHMARKRKGLPPRNRGPRRSPAVRPATPSPNWSWQEPEFETSTPIADWLAGDMSQRNAAIRYVQLCNGVTAQDVQEAFGTEENGNVAHALSSGVRRGLIAAEQTTEGRIYYPIRHRKAA